MTPNGYLITIRKILGWFLCFMLFCLPASADVFQQDSGTEGLVSIEAEDYDANIPAGTHTWNLVTPSGYAGTGAMQAMPNNNTDTYDTGYTATSCRLDYNINFVKTGVHYVWVRGLGASGSDDSVHVGMDGATSSSSDRIGYFQSSWTWSKNTLDAAVATINITTAGEHTINVWMREDGMVFDKLVLTTSSEYTLTGTGPDESSRSSNTSTTTTGSSGADGLIVTEEGNVGIGISTPTERLEVDGHIKISTSDPYLKVDADTKHLVLSGGNGWADTGAVMVLRGKNASNNAYGMEWYAGNAERMRMLSNGNVGIGKVDPATKLDVYGDVKMTNPSGRSLIVERDNDDSWITFHDPGDVWYSLGIDVSDGRKLKLNYGGAVGDNDHFVMTAAGDVGIGTGNPAAKLDVIGDIHIASGHTLYSPGQMHINGEELLYIYNKSGVVISKDGGGNGNLTVQGDSILTGNVGIGTTSPTAKLDVNGNSKITGNLTVTNSVNAYCVTTSCGGGADYVFQPDYTLPSLESLSAYVQEHHHLPEVPSAREMEENGLNLSAQTITHLKKIEELTLYMIDLKKENDQLKSIITNLSSRLAVLEAGQGGNMN